MEPLLDDYRAMLTGAHGRPCLSLYQPTHRHHPENQQDPIRFRNLVKTLEESLLRSYPPDEVQPLLAPFHALTGLLWSTRGEQITRVEVHLSDANGHKSGGEDKRCLIEARLAGRPPMAVRHRAATLEQAFEGGRRGHS